MIKKVVFAIIAAVMLLVIPVAASAKPKQPLAIENINYTSAKQIGVPIDVTLPHSPNFANLADKGQLYYAEGSGTLGEHTVNIRQLFAFQADGDSVKVLTAARLRTELEDGTPIEMFFKGRGTGTITCGGDYCELTILQVKMGEYEKAAKNLKEAMAIRARTKGGAKLAFNLIARINIDHTSAGIVLLPDDNGIYISGSANFAGFGRPAHSDLINSD